MKICFISPPTPFFEYTGFPPLNILYLDSYIKEHGYTDTSISDLNITNDIPSADIYIMTATTPQFPYAKNLAQNLEGIKIIGGAHATAIPSDCEIFHKVVISDGEKALIQCLKDIKNDVNRHIYIGEQIKNLDNVPMPNRHEIDINKYNYFIDDALSTIAMTSRGCPYNCYFCQKVSKNVRLHSNDYVKKEIRNILDCGYKGIYFVDDIFTLRKDLIDITPELKNIAWQCQIRPDEKINNIRTLAKMGCRNISIGLESGSQKILDIVNKRIDLKNVPDVIKECKKQNVKIRTYIVIGLPSESHETIKQTIDFLRLTEPDSVGIGIFVPYPGTYIYNHKELFDIKIEEIDYEKWHFRGGKKGYYSVVSTSNITKEDLLKYREEIDREFNK